MGYGVQNRSDLINLPFLLSGRSFIRDNETIAQIIGRSTDLLTYTLMGRQQAAVPTTGTGTGNTGTGTMTAVALIPGVTPAAGTYTFTCIAAVANGGVFKVTDPNGNVLKNNITMAPGAGAATQFYYAEFGLTFTLTDAATDFIVGDKFTLAVTNPNAWVPFNPAACDGSQVPAGIYTGDTIPAAIIAAGAVTSCPIVVGGEGSEFDYSLMTVENSASVATVLPGGRTVRECLYLLGLFSMDTIDIDYFENET